MQLTRRRVLAGVTGGIAALAGCSAVDDTGELGCTTEVVNPGDHPVIATVTAISRDERSVVLRVELTGNASDLDRLHIADTQGDDRYVVPVLTRDPAAAYEQSLGAPPYHGRYEVVALAADGSELDAMTVDFSCPLE